jgi:hypothetical protein
VVASILEAPSNNCKASLPALASPHKTVRYMGRLASVLWSIFLCVVDSDAAMRGATFKW